MNQLTIITALTKAKQGLDKYLKIMTMITKADVTQDEDFSEII